NPLCSLRNTTWFTRISEPVTNTTINPSTMRSKAVLIRRNIQETAYTKTIANDCQLTIDQKPLLKATRRNLLDSQPRVRVPFSMARELISVILPVYNEAENLTVLLPVLSETLDALSLNHEIVVVDDGSTDQTPTTLRDMSNLQLRVVRLRSNSGQTAALMAGIHFARGDILV